MLFPFAFLHGCILAFCFGAVFSVFIIYFIFRVFSSLVLLLESCQAERMDNLGPLEVF